MKENTKQFLKVSICTLMALVLFAGVILMCIYFAFDNSNDGVAKAYTDEEVGVSNIDFTVDEGFYIKNIYNEDIEYCERMLNYFCYFIPGFMSSDVDFRYNYIVGTLLTSYIDMDNRSYSVTTNIHLDLFKDSDNSLIFLSVYISENYDLYFFDFIYNYEEKYIDDFTVSLIGTYDDSFGFYINFTEHPQIEGTFANQLANEVFGSADDIYSIESLQFRFNNFANLGCFISSNVTFASPPVVIPAGVYNDNLQEQFNDGHADGYEEGYDTGFDTGYDRGFDVGHAGGYEAGVQVGYDDGYQDAINSSQVTIDELQAELDRYESYYESIGWFDVLSSSLNNVSLINIDGYKSTYVDVRVADGTNNQVNVWNLDENPGNGTAFAVVLPRYFGNGTRFRFSYRDLIGSASGMANLPASLGYINSTGNLITIMELPVSSETFVEFNISEDVNTFVIYTTGNLILFQDFKFQVFSFDEIGIYDDGFADGRVEGIKYGEIVGYENGYADARDRYINNDYSFFALFSSVLDAPLQMIIGTDEKPGMLNFYIPGLDINIAPFLLSLFSVALVITVIRFILARAS